MELCTFLKIIEKLHLERIMDPIVLSQSADSEVDSAIGVWPKRFILSYAFEEGMAPEIYTMGLAETGTSANGTNKDRMNEKMGSLEATLNGEIRTRALGKEIFL